MSRDFFSWYLLEFCKSCYRTLTFLSFLLGKNGAAVSFFSINLRVIILAQDDNIQKAQKMSFPSTTTTRREESKALFSFLACCRQFWKFDKWPTSCCLFTQINMKQLFLIHEIFLAMLKLQVHSQFGTLFEREKKRNAWAQNTRTFFSSLMSILWNATLQSTITFVSPAQHYISMGFLNINFICSTNNELQIGKCTMKLFWSFWHMSSAIPHYLPTFKFLSHVFSSVIIFTGLLSQEYTIMNSIF